jgi:endonuclease YncB( thermonuclease family)
MSRRLYLSIMFSVLTFGVFIVSMPLWLTSCQYVGENSIYGIANVLDGDTIKIHDHHIRLSGIDAPEKNQECISKSKEILKCGKISLETLSTKIENEAVYCDIKSRDMYKRYIGQCYVGEEERQDISQFMVYNGLALAYREYSKEYIDEEKYAKENKLGLWSMTFTYPWEWRKQQKIK